MSPASSIFALMTSILFALVAFTGCSERVEYPKPQQEDPSYRQAAFLSVDNEVIKLTGKTKYDLTLDLNGTRYTENGLEKFESPKEFILFPGLYCASIILWRPSFWSLPPKIVYFIGIPFKIKEKEKLKMYANENFTISLRSSVYIYSENGELISLLDQKENTFYQEGLPDQFIEQCGPHWSGR